VFVVIAEVVVFIKAFSVKRCFY